MVQIWIQTALRALRHFFQQHFYRTTKSIKSNQLSVSATKVTAWVLDIANFYFAKKHKIANNSATNEAAKK
jgi:hypothetical protein